MVNFSIFCGKEDIDLQIVINLTVGVSCCLDKAKETKIGYEKNLGPNKSAQWGTILHKKPRPRLTQGPHIHKMSQLHQVQDVNKQKLVCL